MQTENSTDLLTRVEKLERQNLILKVIGSAVLLFAAYSFGSNQNFGFKDNTTITAQKFAIVNDKGKECGYLGYDAETQNPKLFFTDCGTDNERITLSTNKYVPALRLGGVGSTAILQGGTEKPQNGNWNSQAILQLWADYAGSASISSGDQQSAPQMLLDGKKKGSVQLFADGDFFKIYDDGNKKRFSVRKTDRDAISLFFFDKDGKETHRFPAVKP